MPLASGASKAVPVPPKEPRKRSRSSGYGRISKKTNDSTPSTRASTPSTRASSCASSPRSSRSSSRAPSTASSRTSSRASSPSSSVVPLPPINTPAREKPMASDSLLLRATPRHMDILDATSLPPTPLPSHSVFLALTLTPLNRNVEAVNTPCAASSKPPKPHGRQHAASLPTPGELEDACLKVDAARAKKRDASKPPTGKKAVEMRRRQLDQACLNGDVESAKKCRLPRSVLSEKLSSGEAPLHHAIKNQHFAFVEFLVQHGVDINTEDEKGRTALQIAAANNDTEAMNRLVELGAEVKAQDSLGLLWLKSHQ